MLTRPAAAGLALAVLAGFLATPARAADELHTPYDLRIVLHVAEHRLLGDVFRERVTRELRDGLQAALGDLAMVSVVREHPRLKDVLNYGLEKGLDGWTERSPTKTHFVLIDIAGSEYDIQARQYDGPTGRASRVVRHDRTRDRDFVARAAALLVAHDFGLVGTVISEPDGQMQVKVALQAGALGPVTRWLRKGRVFEILPPGGGVPLPWALLQVQDQPAEDSGGVIVCKLLRRYEITNLVGHRCLLLGTTRSALRLRFMQEKGNVQVPLDRSLTVAIRRKDFVGEKNTQLKKSTDQAGWIDTTRDGADGVFEDVAFVSVTGGMQGVLPQVPVAIVDDRPVIIPVTLTGEAGGLLIARRAGWERKVADSYLVQVSLFQELQELQDQAAKPDAKPEARARMLDKARAGFDRVKRDSRHLQDEREALAQETARTRGVFKPDREDQLLKVLQQGEASLQRFLGEQEQIDREENDPKKKQLRTELQRARLLEEQEFEVGKAIEKYEKVLAAGLKDPDLRKHVEELKAMWQTKDEKHKEARLFIYNVWPTLDNEGVKEHLAEAVQAFAECRRVKDLISPRKLFKATEAHAVRMNKELEKLKPAINIDDEKPAKLIESVAPGLKKLASDIVVFLQREQPME
jgi:hypothetical protein